MDDAQIIARLEQLRTEHRDLDAAITALGASATPEIGRAHV